MPAVTSSARSKGRRTVSEINMVPFIDVMLVLLIIFMVTAPLITPSTVDLPSLGKANQQPNTVIYVTIDANGALKVASNQPQTNSYPTTLNNLAQKVQQVQATLAPNTPVIINADKSIKYELVVSAMDRLQRAGIQRVGLAVQLKN